MPHIETLLPRVGGINSDIYLLYTSRCEKETGVTFEADNAGGKRFYVQHGFAYADTFMLYGRAMHRYQEKLPTASARVEV